VRVVVLDHGSTSGGDRQRARAGEGEAVDGWRSEKRLFVRLRRKLGG